MTEMFSRLTGPTLVVFQGLPASGKTERAKREILAAPPGRIVRCNRDDLRRSMCIEPNYKQDQEERVTTAQHAMITALLRAGAVIICDDANLRGTHVATLRAVAAWAHADFRLVDDFLRVTPEECIRRDKLRGPAPGAGERVGEEVILRMWHNYLAERKGRTG